MKLSCAVRLTRRSRGIVDLDVIDAAASDAEILFRGGHAIETIEIMLPALHGDEAEAGENARIVADQRGAHRIVVSQFSVPSLVTGEIAAAIVQEGVTPVVQNETRATARLRSAQARCMIYARCRAQPDRHRCRCRRQFQSGSGERWKPRSPGISAPSAETRTRPEADHRSFAVGELGKRAQAVLRARGGFERESQITRDRRYREKDRLVVCSCSGQFLGQEWRCHAGLSAVLSTPQVFSKWQLGGKTGAVSGIAALPSLHRTLSTRAIEGPRRAQRSSASTVSGGPTPALPTLPSWRLRTQPTGRGAALSAQNDQR